MLAQRIEHAQTDCLGQWITLETVSDQIQRRSASKLMRITRGQLRQGIIETGVKKTATIVIEDNYAEFLGPLRRACGWRFVHSSNRRKFPSVAYRQNEIHQIRKYGHER